MNLRVVLIFPVLFFSAVSWGQIPLGAATGGNTIAVTATITLRQPILTSAPLSPRAPYTLPRGAHLQFVVPTANLPSSEFAWFKDGKRLAVTGPTLDIPSATAADTGYYTAEAHVEGGTATTFSSESAHVLIANGGQRLLNISTLARIDATQPVILTGFVVEPGPSHTMVLIRAVGPALGGYGVHDPLATPQLRVTDSSGREYTPYQGIAQPVPTDGSPDTHFFADATAARVGAFPLPSGSADLAQVFVLSSGAYTAHVSSATSGNNGTVLVEIYEVPL